MPYLDLAGLAGSAAPCGLLISALESLGRSEAREGARQYIHLNEIHGSLK